VSAVLTPVSRRPRPRRRRLLLGPVVAAAAVLATALLATGLLWPMHTRRKSDPPAPTVVRRQTTVARRVRRPIPVAHTERSTGRLAAPVQDEAATWSGGRRALLLGGLTAADTSRTDVLVASSHGGRPAGALPIGLHDTAAVHLGSSVYLFGGGTATNTQSADILRIAETGGPMTKVGSLPSPSSDHSAVTVGDTVYVVGGYTGSAWLDTVVAWRPGAAARIVARLPYPVRYAAVAATGAKVVIAGGSLTSGAATSGVLVFDTRTHRVTRLGSLPAPTTHAAAASLHGRVYVIGGRSATLDTPTAGVVAVDVQRRTVHAAGSLDSPRSDLAAVGFPDHILLAGGRGPGGVESTLSELRPSAGARTAQSSAALDVYAHDAAGRLAPAARAAKQLVYVPNSRSDTVDVIDPQTYKVVEHFAVGGLPQHVVPAWDLRSLYVTNDTGNSLTRIDPRTGKPGATIPVDDPYNMYFTPDGRYAIVVAERLRRLDFRDAHTFRLHHSLAVPCTGVDHMDFTADGRFLLASCEFSGTMVEVDVAHERVVRTVALPAGPMSMPQDVKLSPDGGIFYVADMRNGGVWEIDAHTFRVLTFMRTGAGAHGLYPSRDSQRLYVSNRGAGTVSVVDFATRRIVDTWRIPGGSPDMGGVSADGKVLWLSGRYDGEVYAISTADGKLLARIPVGAGPHGLCVWPQPGRYSLGHTGILR
jgi:YVTN family beta-propeller protein